MMGFFLLVLLLSLIRISSATVFPVGDNLGWNLNVNYTQWASKYTFRMGDSLVFTISGLHSVLMVGEVDYVVCNIHNPMQVVENAKPVTIVTRKSFFICGIPGHCITGMKVAIYATDRISSPNSLEVSEHKRGSSRVRHVVVLLLVLGIVI